MFVFYVAGIHGQSLESLKPVNELYKIFSKLCLKRKMQLNLCATFTRSAGGDTAKQILDIEACY